MHIQAVISLAYVWRGHKIVFHDELVQFEGPSSSRDRERRRGA
jgi:hypothetical protein